MSICEDLIRRVKNKNNTDDDWEKLQEDINKFLDEDHPIEEKEKFYPLGYLEIVNKMCDHSGD